MNYTLKKILAGSCLSLVLYSCEQRNEAIHPEYRKITQSVYASGIIKTRNQYQVFASSAGLINKIYISEGDSIRTGQVLLTISNPVVDQTKLNSLDELTYNEFKNNIDKLKDLENQVDIAKQKCINDSLLYLRQENLWNQGIGTRIELEQKELEAQTSKSNYESQKLRYNQLKRQLDFGERQSRNQVAIASTQQSELDVKSRINGKVFSVLKKQGEMVTAQTPIAIIGENAHLYVELQIDENDISLVALEQQVYITMDSYKDSVFQAIISKIYPMMNERSRTITVEAEFIRKPPIIYPNLTVEANIVIRVKERALLIPRNYLINETYVLDKNKHRIKVKIGLRDYQYAEILSGLTAESQIIKPEQ